MPTNKNEKRAEILFDLLSDGDQTYETVCERTGWTRKEFFKAAQTLRDILAANGDVISVVAEPQGSREPWKYSLAAGTVIMDPEKSRWVINRLQDAERRLFTIGNVTEVASKALDGRTTDGRKARIYNLHIKRAQEEVALLTADE